VTAGEKGLYGECADVVQFAPAFDIINLFS